MPYKTLERRRQWARDRALARFADQGLIPVNPSGSRSPLVCSYCGYRSTRDGIGSHKRHYWNCIMMPELDVQGVDVPGLIKNPTHVLEQYLEAHGLQRGYQWGRLAMALELITVVRSLEVFGESMADFEREQIVSVIDTFMVSQGVAETAAVFYEKLLEWRKVKFVAVEGDESDDRDALPSEREAPRGDAAPPSHNGAQPGTGRSPGLPSSRSPL